MRIELRNWTLAILTIVVATLYSGAQRAQDPPVGPADAIIDLATQEGTSLVKGQWRYHDVKIEETDFRGPGPDL